MDFLLMRIYTREMDSTLSLIMDKNGTLKAPISMAKIPNLFSKNMMLSYLNATLIKKDSDSKKKIKTAPAYSFHLNWMNILIKMINGISVLIWILRMTLLPFLLIIKKNEILILFFFTKI